MARTLVLLQLLIAVVCMGLEDALYERNQPSGGAGAVAVMVRPGGKGAAQPGVAPADDKAVQGVADELRQATDALQTDQMNAMNSDKASAMMRRKYRKLKTKLSGTPRGPAHTKLRKEIGALKVERVVESDKQKVAEKRFETQQAAVHDLVQKTQTAASDQVTDAEQTAQAVKVKVDSDQKAIASTKKALADEVKNIEQATAKDDALSEKSSMAVVEVEGRIADARTALTESQAKVKAAKKVLKTKPRGGQAMKAKAALRANVKKVSQEFKKVSQMQGVMKKLGAIEQTGSTAKLPPKPDPCGIALEKTNVNCYKAAAEEIKETEFVDNVLGNHEVRVLGESSTRLTQSAATKAKVEQRAEKCKAKASEVFKQCEQMTKELHEQEQLAQDAKKQLAEVSTKRQTGKEVQKLVAQHEKEVKKINEQSQALPPSATGIFLAKDAVFYVGRKGKKSLIEFPTVACKTATSGIDPDAFDDEKLSSYYLDAKASEIACEGPAYSNAEDPTVYTNCDCVGVANDNEQGSKCHAWQSNELPWCFVAMRCAHPSVRHTYAHDMSKQLPDGLAIFEGCVLGDSL